MMSTQPKASLARIIPAARYAYQGLQFAWQQAAFRQECYVAVLLIPAAFEVGTNWLEVLLLIGTVWIVLVVEILNSAIEATIDRISTEHHPLAGQAKDLGGAAVLLSIIFCIVVWCTALVHRFF